jgi:hypothetical protein
LEFFLISYLLVEFFMLYVDSRQNKKYKERTLDDCIKNEIDIDEIDKNNEYN